MESFSWSDSLRALAAPCLSCLRASKTERNDLEDLLADSASGTTTDRDAETLSLHSNPGAPRRKRTRFTKSIRLFGWNLFGRPPIRLPDDDEDDEEGQEQGQGSGSRRRSRRVPPPTLSSSTLDSDAAPLDSAAIESHATKRAEEEAARAERRARRRERKERKSAALAQALEHAAVLDGNAEFEGFPGSGGRRPPLPASPFARSSEGDYQDDDDDDEEEGDFGAGAYARRTRGGSDSGRGSDSRSRTSTSLSSGPQQQQGPSYNHHYISQQPSAHPAVPPPAVPSLHTQRSKKGKSSRSSASKTSSSSRRSRSSPSASQSPSLASPVATQFLDAAAPAPRTAQEFEGFPSDLGLHTAGIERLSSGFPSPGIGGRRNGKRDMGAFLANRGDA
ncbi:hypothetical protein EDB89DRAFT_2070655 [Lactarius sanguifluus]|nr:hypothetical protein EDB89DRAFT_2070655 [Lactarius sanguifluus]